MHIIAHRANVDGVNSATENHPTHVDKAHTQGFDVEIDMWYVAGKTPLFLGHDAPLYPITHAWLAERGHYLWVHCKNIDALHFCATHKHLGFDFFWHEGDAYTLTHKGFIWTYPRQPHTSRCILVKPELWQTPPYQLPSPFCVGLCTDRPRPCPQRLLPSPPSSPPPPLS